jgi:hypothetical protein
MYANSSTAIEDLQGLCRNDSTKRLAYWYFQFSDKDSQKVYNMMRSFIRQLSSLPLLPAIIQLWNNHKTAGSEPDIGELAKALNEVIGNIEGEVFIVMDALDECPRTEDQPKMEKFQPEREKLLRHINSLLDGGGRNVHILATSRPEPDIHDSLDNSATARDIEELMADDVRQFVQTEIAQDKRLSRWPNTVKSQIKEKLLATEERYISFGY